MPVVFYILEHLLSIYPKFWMLYFDTTDKDWEDIKFGVDNQIDFYAVSFVKDAKVVHELKNYLKSKVSSVNFFRTEI